LIEDNQATVKKFYREEGRIRLEPANQDYEAFYPAVIAVQGKVTLAIKRF
jgi:SOS-response transcriptional repressor LexA